jgi:hypothetical protein
MLHAPFQCAQTHLLGLLFPLLQVFREGQLPVRKRGFLRGWLILLEVEFDDPVVEAAREGSGDSQHY